MHCRLQIKILAFSGLEVIQCPHIQQAYRCTALLAFKKMYIHFSHTLVISLPSVLVWLTNSMLRLQLSEALICTASVIAHVVRVYCEVRGTGTVYLFVVEYSVVPTYRARVTWLCRNNSR